MKILEPTNINATVYDIRKVFFKYSHIYIHFKI